MAAGTVGEGTPSDDVPDPDSLSPEALAGALAADVTGVDLGGFVAIHHTHADVAEAAVLQVRAHGLEQIGARVVGTLGDGVDRATWLTRSVVALGDLEDSDGLSSDWISAIVLTGDQAASPDLDELIRRSHPNVPVLRPAPPDPAATPTPAAAVLPAPARHVVPAQNTGRVPGDREAAPTLAARFGALNPDWDLGDDEPAADHARLPAVRRHERAIVAAALVLAVAVAGVVTDHGSEDAEPQAPIPPVASDPTEATSTAMVTPDAEFDIPGKEASDDNTWVIDFPDAPDERTRTYTVTYVFDSMLTERDLPDDWNQTVAVPAADLDRLCNGVSSPPVLTTIDRQFASPSGDERVWSGVRIFENSVTAQAALRSTERALGRCDLVLHVDDDRGVIRSEIVHLDRALVPDVGDSSFAVATRTADSRDAAVSLYGLARWRRCLAVLEYSVDVGRTPTGWPPSVGSERHLRFEQLLRAAARRMERSAGDCPSVTPTQ